MFLEDYVPGAHGTATFHDALLAYLRSQGWSDLQANVPTMPIAALTELLNQFNRSLGHPLYPTCHG